ncbi:MAG TPA: ATPase, T2SS/T4P/T4SS family, partial [Myxococcota bacterium]|nr:ATPase, T2SS/T4P/T4SS family [Myxococcota bacterium]
MSGTGNEFISRLLLEHRLVDVESLAKAEEARGQRQERGLVETLLDMGLMEEKRYLAAFGSILGLDVLESLPLDDVDLNLLKLVPITWARENSVLPIRRDDDRIVAAISNPLNLSIVDDLKALFGARVEIVLASNDVVEDGINQAYQRLTGLEGTASAVFGDDENDLEKAAADLEESSRDLLDVTDEAPVIRLVNSILGQAVKERVSDIHIEPFEKLLSVRFRKDGILREVLRPPKRFQASITSRIKIMGNLNIAEKRLPQDGRIRRVVGKTLFGDVQVAHN